MSTTFIIARRQEPQTTLQRLFAAAGISLAVLLGLSATAEAALVISLQQVGAPPVAVPGQKTIVLASILASGNLGAVVPVDSFETVLTWNVGPGSSATNLSLKTVEIGGNPTEGSGALIVSGPSFFFAEASPVGFMNTNFGNPDNQRVTGVLAGSLVNFPAGEFFNFKIMDIRFGLDADVGEATYSFSIAGTDPDGFYSGGDYALGFPTGSGTITVVPEPGTIPACLLGLVVIGGWITRRSSRQRNSSAPMASAA